MLYSVARVRLAGLVAGASIPMGQEKYKGGTSIVMSPSPNILEVMSFRMSTRVTTRNCPDPQGKWMTYLLYFSAWKVEREKYVFKYIIGG